MSALPNHIIRIARSILLFSLLFMSKPDCCFRSHDRDPLRSLYPMHLHHTLRIVLPCIPSWWIKVYLRFNFVPDITLIYLGPLHLTFVASISALWYCIALHYLHTTSQMYAINHQCALKANAIIFGMSPINCPRCFSETIIHLANRNVCQL